MDSWFGAINYPQTFRQGLLKAVDNSGMKTEYLLLDRRDAFERCECLGLKTTKAEKQNSLKTFHIHFSIAAI